MKNWAIIIRFATFRRALDDEMRQADYEGTANKCRRPEREGTRPNSTTSEMQKISRENTLVRK